MPTELVLERRRQAADPSVAGVTPGGVAVMVGGPGGDEEWSYRVVLSPVQAIIGFRKFFTIGIGFLVEDEWNTNSPYSMDARAILDHIRCNKGDDAISDGDCLAAIRMIQDAAREDLE